MPIPLDPAPVLHYLESVLLLVLLACGEAEERPDVLLVSLDTTRADLADAETMPNLAALAARGTRFAHALTHAPTTLSAHASVFTGLDPHGHRVVRNGFTLRTGVPTLAERFRDAGWATLGVAGADVLDGATGIGRGFGVWDTSYEVVRGERYEAVAEDVTARAIARAAAMARPRFVFVHYFDAHAPYAAPAPWTRRFGDPAYAGSFDGSRAAMDELATAMREGRADPADVAELRARYRGELAYVDAQLGRLLAAFPDAIVAVFGDHGEMLGEEPARPLGHGTDLDHPVSRVPLVIAGPGVPVRVVEGAVGLREVGGMVWAAARGEPIGGSGGPVFMEATQPLSAEHREGWNNLRMERGVARGERVLLAAPWLGETSVVYHLVSGGRLPAGDPALEAELLAWDAAAPGYVSPGVAAGQEEALRALGYAE